MASFLFTTDAYPGPIVPIMPWSTDDEVIERANSTQMGLGASVWTNDLVQGEYIAQNLEAGNVWVNAHGEVGPAFTFGGHKQSGVGSEWGTAGLKSFCNTQTLFVKKKP
jgi:acyl-CoA reductase-like NAD-dependent aldehyde dehydrogenase